jgi:cell division transport system permease protein
MITATRRVFKAGFVGFWRNAYVSFSSIYVIVIALFVIGSTMFLDQILTKSLETVQSRVDINVYCVPEAAQEDIESIQTAVSALQEVTNVTFISREEALRLYRERNRTDEIAMQALEELDENPLGASLTIQAQSVSQYESINTFLEEQNQALAPAVVIDEINFERNREAIETLERVIEAVEQASYMVMLVLLGAAALITFNTISLAIYTAREEISIMRLVGASNMFIRGPFILQGMLYGFVSAIITLAIFYPLLVWLGPRTEAFFELNLFTYYMNHFGQIFGVLVGVGVALGFFSSMVAIARYLRT